MLQSRPESSCTIRDARYYWNDVIFQVENRLFKIPSHYLVQHSEIFADTFGLPQGTQGPEGISDENPVVLHGITALDFEHLLEIVYPQKIPQDYSAFNKDKWISVLKLSTMWQLSDIRQLAIEYLQQDAKLDPVERVVLAKSYSISPWLRTGYLSLVKRVQSLSAEEAEQIGFKSAIQIYQLREDALVKQAGNRGYVKYNGTLTDHDVQAAFDKVFQEEFRLADAASQRYLDA
ncbi:uncharacterized protein EV420DRAFT_307115 [Desarmillaria tabescens]|uniref:BTB domain-containing protein n=1 Tax=Armillaria tabescens TaxID=1929756 RepID=A0AA39KFU6_ARMTA|nr:uncharacterized protein EV420DRAFT_307115 [Desarmillaria tabescens]KAK0459180.1 hypothetical protein EV420DRAFT_307115 [Desarmillaria tabescens]